MEVHLRRTLTTCDAFQAGCDPLCEELENLDYDVKFYARISGNYEFDDFIRGACQIIMPSVAKIFDRRNALLTSARACWIATGGRPCQSNAPLSALGARFAAMGSV